MKTTKLLTGILTTVIGLTSLVLPTFALEVNNTLELKEISNNGTESVLELNILNPSNQQITSVQSWLEFDSSKLKGKSIDTTGSAFDFVVPGESNFDSNLVKIGRSSLSGNTTESKLFVARITFEILKGAGEVKFYDYQVGDGGHVSIQVFDNGFPVNTLGTEPKSIVINTGQIQQVAEQVTTTVGLNTSSNLIRPSNTKIGTSIGSAHIAWDLVSGAQSYYVYYGKTSGRYLNRRLVGNVNNYILDGLETGKKYFFAITAIDGANLESDYSDESTVVIGKSETASNPIKIIKNIKNNNNTKIVIQNGNTANLMVGNSNINISQNAKSGPTEVIIISLLIAILTAFGIRKFRTV